MHQHLQQVFISFCCVVWPVAVNMDLELTLLQSIQMLLHVVLLLRLQTGDADGVIMAGGKGTFDRQLFF